MQKAILKWEAGGIAFIFLVGALFHFLYEWSGESALVGALASVNESVWEHFKQGFWPLCIFALIEYPFVRRFSANLAAAKGLEAVLIPLFTGLVFYAYTGLTGHEILAVDISIFALAVTLGQLVSARVLSLPPLPRPLAWIGLATIGVIGLILILFTFFPPHGPLWLDHNSGIYGLP